jgi:hypothetical protein
MRKTMYIDKVAGDGTCTIIELPPLKTYMLQAMDQRLRDAAQVPEGFRARRDALAYGPGGRPAESIDVGGGGRAYEQGQAVERTLEMTAKLALGQLRRRGERDGPSGGRDHEKDMVREVAAWLTQKGYVPADRSGVPIPADRLGEYDDLVVTVLRERGPLRKAWNSLASSLTGKERDDAPDYLGAFFFLPDPGMEMDRGFSCAEGSADRDAMEEARVRLQRDYHLPIMRDSGWRLSDIIGRR